MENLGNLGYGYSIPWAINDSGQIAGEGGHPSWPISQGFVRDADGTMATIGDYASQDVRITGINDSGVAVGYLNTDVTFWKDGVMTTLPGLTDFTLAMAVNNLGQIAGRDGQNWFIFRGADDDAVGR